MEIKSCKGWQELTDETTDSSAWLEMKSKCYDTEGNKTGKELIIGHGHG